jgi:hypothetical protein
MANKKSIKQNRKLTSSEQIALKLERMSDEEFDKWWKSISREHHSDDRSVRADEFIKTWTYCNPEPPSQNP